MPARVTRPEADPVAIAALTDAKGVCVHDGADYPPRPDGFGSVEFIGPDDPDALAEDGDTWVQTPA